MVGGVKGGLWRVASVIQGRIEPVADLLRSLQGCCSPCSGFAKTVASDRISSSASKSSSRPKLALTAQEWEGRQQDAH